MMRIEILLNKGVWMKLKFYGIEGGPLGLGGRFKVANGHFNRTKIKLKLLKAI